MINAIKALTGMKIGPDGPTRAKKQPKEPKVLTVDVPDVDLDVGGFNYPPDDMAIGPKRLGRKRRRWAA